jgi:2-polyprenyl-6-methoxyphenol hydroxylase-like FAD-dependent oxidoreductase
MTNIGIVGAGIAGLHLGLFLRQHGIPATIYTEKSATDQLGSRLPGLVARVGHTRDREIQLGVNYWDQANNEIPQVHFSVAGEQPLAFIGNVTRPSIVVDMRIYVSRLLEEFAKRGGQVVVAEMSIADLERAAADHDLMVVATGRGGLSGLFPRIPEHSPFTSPQRIISAGLFRGISYLKPIGASLAIAPGQGEIIEFPIYSFEPRVTGLLFEAIPGGVFEVLTKMRYEDDPRGFERTMLKLLQQHAPAIYARVDRSRFGLTRPLDLLQGGVTPSVRRGYVRLGSDKWALALGDAHLINDPITGQGANTASKMAWILGEAIRDGATFDEAFCKRMEQIAWNYSAPIVAWSNAMLQAPPPHQIELLVAASQHQPVADIFANFFELPHRAWDIMSRPENTTDFLRQYGWQGMPQMQQAA